MGLSLLPKLMTDPVWWFFLIWLPDFFKQTRGLDIKKSWVLLVTIYSIVTVLSIAGGWVTGHLTKMGWSMNRARKGGMLLFALCVVPILAVTGASDWGAVLLIGLAGAAHQAFSANLFTTVSDFFPEAGGGFGDWDWGNGGSHGRHALSQSSRECCSTPTKRLEMSRQDMGFFLPFAREPTYFPFSFSRS